MGTQTHRYKQVHEGTQKQSDKQLLSLGWKVLHGTLWVRFDSLLRRNPNLASFYKRVAISESLRALYACCEEEEHFSQKLVSILKRLDHIGDWRSAEECEDTVRMLISPHWKKEVEEEEIPDLWEWLETKLILLVLQGYHQ